MARISVSTKINSLFQELKRRKVINSALLYVASCWIVIQVAAMLFPELAENTVAMRYLFAAFTLGLPVIIFIAWFYELTPGGLVRVAAFVERRGLDNIAPKNDRRIDAKTGESTNVDYSKWSIFAENGPLEGLEYLVSDSLNIGRALECDVTLLRSSISRNHANLTVDREGRMVIEDLDSSNGTYVNGARIAGSQYLHHGDKVHFNDVIFRVKEDLTTRSDEAALNQTIIVK